MSDAAKRLWAVVRSAGGREKVAMRANVPLGILDGYIAGNEMHLDAALRLAETCGVSVGWLATGGELEAPPTPPRASKDFDVALLIAIADEIAAWERENEIRIGRPRVGLAVRMMQVVEGWHPAPRPAP